jgi:hypothetical protein
MAKTGRFTVMDSSEEATILDRLAPNRTICTAVECALEAGKLLGVQKVVAGRVTELSPGTYKVSVIQVDVGSGETVTSETTRHSGGLAGASKSMGPVAEELAVTASPNGAGFRAEQSRWRWKTGLYLGAAMAMALAGGYFAAEVGASNDRQKDDRVQAEQATTLVDYNKFVKKLKNEKATGESLRNQTIVAEVAFGALFFMSYRSWRNPPELPAVAWDVFPAAPQGGLGLAVSYSW